MEKEDQPFSFGIIRILDCGFAIQELIPPDEDKIKMGYGMNFVFDVNTSWIEFIVSVEFKHADNDLTFLSGSTLTRFGVNNLGGFVNEDDKVEFPDGALETLFGIAFTHMRAILSKNIAGSRFSDIIVPVINPSVVFHELLKTNIEMRTNLNQRLKDEEKQVRSNIELAKTERGEKLKRHKKIKQ